MKKSSLLALSLASLVGLVSCGKDSGGPSKVSPRKFDSTFYNNILKIYQKEGTIKHHDHAIMTFEQSWDDSGVFAEQDAYYGDKAKNSIKWDAHIVEGEDEEGYAVWSVDEPEWSEEEVAAAQQVLDSYSYLGYIIANLLNPIYYEYAGMAQYLTDYPEDPEEEWEDDGTYTFFVSPYLIKQAYEGEADDGETEDFTFAYEYKGAMAYTYNKYGELVKQADVCSLSKATREDESGEVVKLSGKGGYKTVLSYKYYEVAESEEI